MSTFILLLKKKQTTNEPTLSLCVCIHMHMCLCASEGQRSTLGGIPQNTVHLVSLRQCLSLAWGMSGGLRLSERAPGSFLPLPLHAEITSEHSLAFCIGFPLTQGLLPAQQGFLLTKLSLQSGFVCFLFVYFVCVCLFYSFWRHSLTM